MPIRQLSLPRDAWLDRWPLVRVDGGDVVTIYAPSAFGDVEANVFFVDRQQVLTGVWRVGAKPVALA